MSNYWNAYCKTCNARGGFHLNRGDDRIEAICRYHAPALAALHRAGVAMVEAYTAWQKAPLETRGPSPPWADTEISIFYSCENGVELDFFAKHDGHELTAIDEAGRLYGQCGAYPTAKIDGKWLLCGLPSHDEKTPHVFTVVPEWDRAIVSA